MIVTRSTRVPFAAIRERELKTPVNPVAEIEAPKQSPKIYEVFEKTMGHIAMLMLVQSNRF